jgi:hypothetical protein
MNINESRAYQAEKDHLMRHEGKHPANYSREEKAASNIFPKEEIPNDHVA